MRFPKFALRFCIALVMTAMGTLLFGQLTEGPIKGFQRADVDPQTGQRRSLLSGGTMEQLTPQQLRISGGVRVEVYDPLGATNLVVTAPGCLYDVETRVVHSPGALRFATGNGQFELEGEGFRLEQQGERLTISNRVQAVIAKGLLGAPGSTNTGPRVTSQGGPGGSSNRVVRVYSNRFESTTNLAVFLESVRVEDPQGRMHCQTLSLKYEAAGRQIDQVQAEGEVECESGDLTARSQRADYHLVNETIRLEGRPSWRQGEREGSADVAMIYRSQNELQATGDVRMRMPAASTNSAGGLLGFEGLKPQVGAAVNPAGSPTNATGSSMIEVFSESCRFVRDAAVTNRVRGSFDQNVRVVAKEGSLRCHQLLLAWTSRQSQAEELTALGGVLVEEGKDRLQGERLHYTGTNQIVEVTGEPRWVIDGSEGHAGVLRLDLARQSYLAQRQVRMQVPGAAMGGALGALPRFAQQTNRLAAVATPTGTVPPARPQEPRVIHIASEELEFISGARERRGDRIEYRGGVRVEDGEQTTLTSERLTGVTLVGTNRLESLVADGGVVVEVKSPKGARVARGDRLEYRAGPGEVELTGREGVELVMEDPAGASRSRGSRLLYRVLTDVLELEGRPEVISPQGTASGDAAWVDRPRTTVHVTGNWKIRLRAETFGKVRPLPTLPSTLGAGTP